MTHLCLSPMCTLLVQDGFAFCALHAAAEAQRTAVRDVQKLRSGGAVP